MTAEVSPDTNGTAIRSRGTRGAMVMQVAARGARCPDIGPGAWHQLWPVKGDKMHALLALALVAGAVQEPDTGLGAPPPVPVMAVAAAPGFVRYDAGTGIVAQDTGRKR